MEQTMAAFISGVMAAALWSNRLIPDHPILNGLLIPIFLILSGSFFRAFFAACGFIWFGYWAKDQLPGLCSDFAWFHCQARIEPEPAYQFLMATWLGSGVLSAQKWLEDLCRGWHPVWGPWALGLLGGKMDASNRNMSNLYRQLGLLHVLVISGSHFAYLARFVGFLGGLPVRSLYAVRALTFRSWLTLDILIQLSGLIVLTFYALMVGFSPPCQRAFIWIVLSGFVPYFLGPWSSTSHLLLAVASAQAFLFPLNFLSLSNVLSWSTAAVLAIFPRSGWWPSLPRELAMSLIGLTYFGIFSPIGLLLNPLLEHAWGPVLLLAFLGALDLGGSRNAVNWCLDILHAGLESAAAWQQQLWGAPYLAWVQPFDLGLRSLAWLLVMLWVFNLAHFPYQRRE